VSPNEEIALWCERIEALQEGLCRDGEFFIRMGYRASDLVILPMDNGHGLCVLSVVPRSVTTPTEPT